jgi:uncharacterized protein YaaR (DUF327 family)
VAYIRFLKDEAMEKELNKEIEWAKTMWNRGLYEREKENQESWALEKNENKKNELRNWKKLGSKSEKDSERLVWELKERIRDRTEILLRDEMRKNVNKYWNLAL